jgi:glycine oxidase
MVDYLVVGLGLAGIAMCETLEANGKSFMVIDDPAAGASAVAGGIYNPVVLKRLKAAWKAGDQLPLVAPFYARLENKLKIKIQYPATVYRRFATAEEQNSWFEAADDPGLAPFLSTRLIPAYNHGLHAPYGFGEVLGSGRIEAGMLLDAYRAFLKNKGCMQEGRLAHDLLVLKHKEVTYDGLRARKIVFATGVGLRANPYFNYLPIQGNKGEYLHIYCPGLGEERVIKASVFLIPKGGDLYTAGATYDHQDQGAEPTARARTYLEEKLGDLLKLPYQVRAHVAGVRPTVSDRRPLVGRHPAFENMFVINGFGSRGVMIAPYAAAMLYRLMEYGESPDPEIDIARFNLKYFRGAPL